MASGYSKEAMNIVKALRDKEEARSFGIMLDDLHQPAQYSNQGFDREQAFAYLLTRLGEIS
jgi:hypothetical protein